ncbi:flagellin [Campylobacter sp. 19-13652]|uniref:flagellin n=1 Tax=Campylobacter sp. 19-13652 TaxID=2840180 RepID=UPI001C74CA2C|nr:flagellin [Campylobacter sp. 19-13652]BCX79417.1 flagellin C [Campylobacter sp. 19-13652]
MKINQHNSVQHNINQAQSNHSKALQNISVQRALSGVDSANLAIADSLSMQASTMEQGIANANDAIGMLQIADSTLSNINNSAIRMNELSTRANSAVLSDRERNMIRSEMNALKDSMKDSLDNASFNGRNVFGGEMKFQTGSSEVGINLNRPNVDSIDVNSQESINNFIQSTNDARANIGATQNRLLSNINNSLTQNVALRSSESQLQNNDIAKNIDDERNAQLQINASILAQAHNTANLRTQMDRLLA